MLRIGIIGSGNIVRTRHLAAMRSLRKRVSVVGISDTHLDRAKAVAERNSIPRFSANTKDSIEDVPWLHDADALLIATPPFSHGAFVTQALNLGKHVLVEKPFVLDLPEGRRAIALADERKLILAVNHNFQFSRGFRRLQADLASKRLGTVRGIYSFQFSNDTRRLPLWSEDLPLGLFYDESPHVFYLLRRFAGDDIAIDSVYCVPPTNAAKATPHILNIELTCSGVPASIHIDFESPICEWFFAVLGDRGIGYVDLFRDIYSYLPNDGQHLMREVLTTSALATLQHWGGFVRNGWSYVNHSLLYGFETVYKNFCDAIESGDARLVAAHSAPIGLAVNELQLATVERTAGVRT
ncbi:MAG TPA: Gfo/Idh/MocA family oxidoreductase [Candidatus Cybelea sp.]